MSIDGLLGSAILKIMSRYFFDTHMHAMSLTHPNFISFVEAVSHNIAEFVTSGALSPGYLLTPSNWGQQGLVTLLNMFSVFERPIGEIFALIEEDLSGAYRHHERTVKGRTPENLMYPESPYVRDGKIHFRSHVYDRFALVPLVMDFSRDASDEESSSYYISEHQEKLQTYVQDTLDGIRWYQEVRPEGTLEFFPFIGINPEAHSASFIEELLHTHIRLDRTVDWNPKRTKEPKRFRGVKLYPPLGTNPWPKEQRAQDKIDMIYRFCDEHAIPIITHCDDQGFRGVTAKLAQQYTKPSAWVPVLERYPNLKIDFAHYGRQYNPAKRSPIQTLLESSWTHDPWFLEIMELMHRYDHVYADVSFSGTDPSFYTELHRYIEDLDDPDRAERIIDRTLFGSDFTVNLAKVESYTNYLRIFEQSPFSDAAVDAFVSTNPMRFLGLET